MKQIVRYFRETLKTNFKECFGKRYYNWKPETLRTKVREFFTLDRSVLGLPTYNVPINFFETHEFVFFKLIFNTKKDEELKRDFGLTIDPVFSKKMDDVFGSRPSLMNLRSFYSNEAIQCLWNNTAVENTQNNVYRGII